MDAAPEQVWIDGVEAAAVPALDRGLHFGDGLFETIACCRGAPRFLPQHLARLAHGCERLGIVPVDGELLQREVRALAARADRSLLKLLVTRGSATARGYGPSGTERTRRVLLRYAWPAEPAAQAEQGVRVRLARLRLGENPALAGLKHLNRLEQVLARAEWRDPEVFEALLLSSSGRLVSGTMTNVFLATGNVLRTPRLDRCGVAGIMRGLVLREARHAGLAAEEGELGLRELRAAEEAFLTNARLGILPVQEIEGRALAVGPLTRRLQALLAPRLAEPHDA